MLPSWLQNEQVSAQLEESIESYWTSNAESAGPPIVWDAFKAVARGEFISAFKTARVNNNEEFQTLQTRERECAEAHVGSPQGPHLSLCWRQGIFCPYILRTWRI